MGVAQQLLGGFNTAVPSGFSDNFDDGSINAWWQTSGVTIAETGGVMQISGSTTAYVASAATKDLADKYVKIRFVDVPASPSIVQQFFLTDVLTLDNNHYMIQVYNGTLTFERAGAGALYSVAYNSSTHAYFQIRVASGTVYFETSTDGVTYTTRWSGAAAITLTALYVMMRAVNSGGSTHKWDDFASDLS